MQNRVTILSVSFSSNAGKIFLNNSEGTEVAYKFKIVVGLSKASFATEKNLKL